MKKIIFCILALLMSVAMVSCEDSSESNNEEATVDTDFENSEKNNELENMETPTVSTVVDSSIYESEYIYETFEKMEYLDLDDKFLLRSESGNEYIVDKLGHATLLSNASLNSCYPDPEYVKNAGFYVYNIFGEDITDIYTNSIYETVIDVEKLDDKYVIWVKKLEETPKSTLVTFTMMDEQGNSIFEFNNEDCTNHIDKNTVSQLKEIDSVDYKNDNIFSFGVHDSIYYQFSVNIDTREMFDDIGIFSEGYAMMGDVVDVHGNRLYTSDDCSDEEYDIFNNARIMGDGLFYSPNKEAFYDSKLNKVIDLSEYNVVAVSGSNDDIVFKDGYCGVEVENDSGTCFFGIVDKSGNWVLEPTNTASIYSSTSFTSYRGKITDNLLLLGNKIYNISSKEIMDNPVSPGDGELVDGIIYYIDESGEFCKYDYTKSEFETISLYEN